MTIEKIQRPVSERDVEGLALVLMDAVQSGASVSFMADLTLENAREWWRNTLERADPRAVVLAVRDPLGIIGTVSLHPAWPPNQPHRADIAKLLVHRRARRQGVGRALMASIEAHARAAGFTLLTLDTVRGDPAEQLYAAAGWNRVGVIPDYALYPDGRPCDTVIFYKRLA